MFYLTVDSDHLVAAISSYFPDGLRAENTFCVVESECISVMKRSGDLPSS